MKRAGTAVAVAAMVAMSATPALAQKGKEARADFDAMASSAEPIAGLWGLGALLWTQLGTCEKKTNDLDRRQCEGVRDARREQIKGKSFAMSTGSAPLKVAAFNAKKKSAEIELTPCLACDEAVAIGGDQLHIVGQGRIKVSGGTIEVAALHSTARTFKNEEAFAAWKDEVLPRVKSEFVLEVDGAERWKKGGAHGMQVEVVAFRAYDPCTGDVLVSKPASGKISPDTRACGEQKEEKQDPEDPDEVADKPDEPAKPKLPYRLSPFQINMAMAPVRKQSNKCFDAYGVAGKASFEITISKEGKVAAVKQTGDFVDTPTGKCIEKAIRGVTFKKFRKTSITFDFPVILQ